MGGTCTNLLVGKVSLSGHLLCHNPLTSFGSDLAAMGTER